MNASDIQSILFATLGGLLATTGFLLALFVGFCVVAGLPKLRKRTGKSMVVRSLAEHMNGESRFLSSDAPGGPADQLRSPELLEQAGRNP